VDVLVFDEKAIDAMSDASVLMLARQVGVLVEEELQFPALVRARLKRNTYEK
jgi:hypothetical protein